MGGASGMLRSTVVTKLLLLLLLRPATATLVGNAAEVTAPNVPTPVAVRFAWTMNPDVNLANRNGQLYLSAPPFRTDDWPD